MYFSVLKTTILLLASTILAYSIASGQSNKAKAKFDQGVVQNQMGLLVDASLLLTEAIETYPEYAEAYYQRGLSFNGMRQKKAAIKDLEQAIELQIDNIQAYLLLIRWYKSVEEFEKALVVTERIIEQLPDNTAGAYYDQGLIYDKTKEPKKALAAYKNALKHLDADLVEFKNLLEMRVQEIEANLK